MDRRDFFKITVASTVIAGVASCDGLKEECKGDECESLYPFAIDSHNCTGCRICVPKCGKNAIEIDGGRRGVTVNQETCIHCGRCFMTCRFDSIIQKENSDPNTPEHFDYFVNQNTCINCMECFDICKAPASEGGAGVAAIEVYNKDNKAHINQNKCSHCGECVELEFCPWGVINENRV